MARKITCPYCQAQTYDTPTCGRCSKALSPEQEQSEKIEGDLVYKVGMVKRAQEVDRKLKEIVLARFKAIQNTDGVSFSNNKVVVEREQKQYVYTATHSKPILLGPGQYSLAKIMVAGSGRAEESGCLVIEVSEAPIPVTFVFPDLESFGENLISEKDHGLILQGIQGALNSLSLRTSDNFLGGALLQLRLSCTDPIKLVRCQDAAAIDPTAAIKRTGFAKRQFKEPAKPYYARVWDWLRGHKPNAPRSVVTETFEVKPVFVANVYPMIRYELAEAIGNSIRDLEVKALYDKQDTTRAQVRASIKNYMEKTLDAFGLQILDVVAFQFRCPDYEEFLQRKGASSLAKQNLDNEKAEAEVRKDRRELEHSEFEHVEQLEEKKDLSSLDRDARLRDRKDQITGQEALRADQLASEKQTRELQMKKQRLEFERSQRADDEDLEDERQHKKALRALEYQKQLELQQLKMIQELQNAEHHRQLEQQNAEHNRRIEAIKLIAGYPADQQFVLAMQYNPELKDAFASLQQARSNDDKVAMARQFQTQIQEIYGQQSEQTNALLLEAARQLGLVVSEKAKAEAPPQQKNVIIHQVTPTPNNPPPDSTG